MWSTLRSYNQESWSNKFSCQLSSAREVVKTEAEGSPLLEAVAGKGW
jgi:hypothetical protein